jgi:CDP-diacylglycerol--glycerol-3-phosphate 3-phosphatidyltransferase
MCAHLFTVFKIERKTKSAIVSKRPEGRLHLPLASPARRGNNPVMTTANKITIGRILLVPFFIGQVICYARTGQEGYRLGALLSFALAALADALDGYVARHYNQRSELGAILDPLADKLLLISAIILLSFENHRHFDRIPLWLTVIILSRDAILLIGVALIHYMMGKIKVRARLSGKISTVLQMAAVLWILLKWNSRALRYLVAGAGVFTAASGLFYILDGVRQLNTHPASAPAPSQDQF